MLFDMYSCVCPCEQFTVTTTVTIGGDVIDGTVINQFIEAAHLLWSITVGRRETAG